MHLHLATWPPQKQVEQTLDQAFAHKEAMRLHLAERDPQHHAWAKHGVDKEHMQLRILLSYWYYKDVDLDALFAKYFTEPYPEVFADSGAYSAMTQGVAISLEEYAAWTKRWQHLFQVYSNLDVIGDAAGTERNQKALEDLGLKPLPVFHVSASLNYDELERLCDRYSYIALGGLVPYMRYLDRIMPHLVKCFRIAEGRSVFHGFGCTSWTILKALPWYSVDSSSWGQGFRFGQVPVFDDGKGRFIELKLGDRQAWGKHALLVRSLGFNPLDFADRSRNDRAKICAISALSYMKAEAWLRRRHGNIEIPHRPNTDLADANPKRFIEASGGIYEVDTAKALAHSRDAQAGIRLHLADTSNGINLSDADAGLKVYGVAKGQGEGNQMSPGSQAAGLNLHQTASVPSQQAEWRAKRATHEGAKVYLADARGHSGSEIAAAESGLNLYLAEHSLDRGG